MNQRPEPLTGFLDRFLSEVVEADVGMQKNQLGAWQNLAKNPPQGIHLPDNVLEGLEKSRYLGVHEVKLTFNVIPRPLGFWSRLRIIWHFLFSPKKVEKAFYEGELTLIDTDHRGRFELTVTVSRDEEGNLKKSFDPKRADPDKVYVGNPLAAPPTNNES